MATLNALPGQVDVTGYAGDTLTIVVTAPAALVEGREWTAQVKAARDADVADATFAITPPTVADGPAYVVLPSYETARLVTVASGGAFGRTASRAYMPTYNGFWDVQVAGVGGTDPVTTLAQGKLTITLDVTREVGP